MDENLDLIKNVDIKKALEEFEKKSKIEQVQKVPEVLQISKASKMTALVMKWFGIEQRPAEYLLLGFVASLIVISLFLIFREGKKMDDVENLQLLPAIV